MVCVVYVVCVCMLLCVYMCVVSVVCARVLVCVVHVVCMSMSMCVCGTCGMWQHVCVCACVYLWPWLSSVHLAIPVTVPHSFNYCSFRSVQRSFSFIAKSLFFTLFHSCLNHSLKFLLNLIGFDLILLCLSLHFPKLYFTALYYCDLLAPCRLFYSSAHCQIMLVLLRANDHNVIML